MVLEGPKDILHLKAVIEAMLFVHGEPIEGEKLANITRVKKEEAEEALHELCRDYNGRGFSLLEKDGKWQIGTNPECAPFVEELTKGEFSEELSRAALETVAIIAYKGPLTRAEIEFVRGVNTSFTLRNLLMRGLVERMENPRDARSYLYRVSFDFLKHFGLTRITELPSYDDFQKEKIDMGEAAQTPS